jgi:hypothetical protein
MIRRLPLLAVAVLLPGVVAAAEVWKFDNLDRIGGHPVVMLGEPRIVEEDGIKGMVFDGTKDGIFIPTIPITGATAFSVEILFYPAEGGVPAARSGLVEERFLHVGDRAFSRLMFETRKNLKGEWWLDHFMISNGNRSIMAIDPKLVHPTNRWYWLAVTWDGSKMLSYVNGRKEMERTGTFGTFTHGQVSIGVRQTIEYWFKGGVRELRFHREALAPERLQRLD